MRFRILILFVMQVTMVQSIFADAGNCLKTADDFNSKCSEFPKPFDTKLPLMLYKEILGKGAAVKIDSDGSKLKYLAYINGTEKPAYKTENYIEKICFHDDKFEVFYEGADKPLEVIADGGKARILNHKLKRCDVVQFNKTAHEIKEVISEANAPKFDTGAN